MKRFLLIITLLSVLFSFSAFCEDYDVTVRVNGNEIVSDTKPMLKDKRTFLPLRAILNAIGVENENIIWWEMANAVEIRHNDTHIFMVIDSNEIIVNDSLYMVDVPPFVINGRTMVPVRFLSENLNCRVEWDEETFTVDIYTN